MLYGWDGPNGPVDEFGLVPAYDDASIGFWAGEAVHYYWGGRQLMAEVLGEEDGKVVVQDEEESSTGSSISGLENNGTVTFSLVTTGPERRYPPLSDPPGLF